MKSYLLVFALLTVLGISSYAQSASGSPLAGKAPAAAAKQNDKPVDEKTTGLSAKFDGKRPAQQPANAAIPNDSVKLMSSFKPARDSKNTK